MRTLRPLATCHRRGSGSSPRRVRRGPAYVLRSVAWRSSIPATSQSLGGSRRRSSCSSRADLQRHADDFSNRAGFTYTVLDPASRDVIGCVYIYPLPNSDHEARALSWVRASHAQLDTPLWRAVSEWLASDWPFANVDYAPRA